MRKNNIDNFLSKFENRIEIIGKDGVKGIMKHTGPSINENNFIFQNDLFNNIYNKNLTTRNMLEQNKNILKDGNNKNPSYSLSKSYKFQNFNVFKNNNYRDPNFPFNYMENNKTRQSISSNDHYRNANEKLIYSFQFNNKYNNEQFNNYYNNKKVNKYEIGNNRQKIIDNGYKIYTIKDYKNLDNEVNMGKLGLNYKTKEWNEKRERMKKMSEYGKQLMNKEKNHYLKNNEIYEGNSDEKEKVKWNNINYNSKGNSYINEYNNNEFINKSIINKNIKSNNDGKNEEESLKPNTNINYRRRLKNLKNILF